MPYVVGTTVTVWDTDGGLSFVPLTAKYFLGYDDGNPIIQMILARLPSAIICTITTMPQANNLAARICDAESGAFSEQQAAWWCLQKISFRHERPCVYVNVSQKPFVAEELAVYGLEFGRDVDCWVAWWNGIPQIPVGIIETWDGPVGTGVGNIAIQYANVGKEYDMSAALEDFMVLTPPHPVVKIQQGDVMFVRDPTKPDLGECLQVPGIFVRDPITQECGIMANGVTQDLAALWPAIQTAYGPKFVVTQLAGIFKMFPPGKITGTNLGAAWPAIEKAFGGPSQTVLIDDTDTFNLFAPAA